MKNDSANDNKGDKMAVVTVIIIKTFIIHT